MLALPSFDVYVRSAIQFDIYGQKQQSSYEVVTKAKDHQLQTH